jgi:putative endonuclease
LILDSGGMVVLRISSAGERFLDASDVIPAKAGIQPTMPKQPAVYILASKRNGTLYIGVTSNLQKRAGEHKNDLVERFTKRYSVHQLVYYELHGDIVSAMTREKQMKKWS